MITIDLHDDRSRHGGGQPALPLWCDDAVMPGDDHGGRAELRIDTGDHLEHHLAGRRIVGCRELSVPEVPFRDAQLTFRTGEQRVGHDHVGSCLGERPSVAALIGIVVACVGGGSNAIGIFAGFVDDVRFDQNSHSGYYFLNSSEGVWNTGRDEGPNLGYKPRYKQGYFPVPPMDHFQDIRSDMVLALESVGIRVEVHHHEVATGGQTEIDMRFDTLTKMADKVCWYKYCAKNTAKKWGKTATFMPKPLFQDNGSGMHTHQSLWKNGKNLFYERGGYADISKTCLYYIGGVLAEKLRGAGLAVTLVTPAESASKSQKSSCWTTWQSRSRTSMRPWPRSFIEAWQAREFLHFAPPWELAP